MADTTTQLPSLDSGIVEEELSLGGKLKKTFGRIGWVIAGIFLLLLFTLLKLPEDKLRAYVQGMISAQLAQQGITMTAAQSGISIGFGVSYEMKDITLTPAPPAQPIKIEKITVSPYLLALLQHKAGAKIWLENKGGKLDLSFTQSLKPGSGDIAWWAKATNLDLGAMGILPTFANLQGSAVINGTIDIAGDMNVPSTLAGTVALSLAKVTIDSQSIMGFSIPKLSISEGKVEADINRGKATVRNLELGRAGNTADDIRAKVTGDITLGRNWQYSTLNLHATFNLSQTILKSFSLLDALLGAGKKPDGSFAYDISGPVYSPNPTPAK